MEVTFKQAFDSFIDWRGMKSKERTINGYVTHLTHFAMYLRDPNVDVRAITLEHCIDWLKLMQTLGFDSNTLQKKAISIKMLFQFLQRRGVPVLDWDLIPIPARNYKFPRVANEESLRRLLAVIPENKTQWWGIRNKAMILLLWDTGARNGEICTLGMDDINTEKMSARIKTEKSRGSLPFREVFWWDETNAALKKWIKIRSGLVKRFTLEDPNLLFFGVKGWRKTSPFLARRLEVNAVSEILRKYSNKAKLTVPLNPHSCRHRVGRDLAKQGVNTFGIATILGHARSESSYPYTMLFGKDREDLYRSKLAPKGNTGVTGFTAREFVHKRKAGS